MAVVLALSSAVVYGASDFLGGLASRKASVFGVVALSQLAGLAALFALLPWLGGPVTAADLAWAAAAGIVGSTGLVVFFRALSRGAITLITPRARARKKTTSPVEPTTPAAAAQARSAGVTGPPSQGSSARSAATCLGS